MNYKNKKCLVTGGTGLIGRKVVELLLKEGAIVNVVSLDEIRFNPHEYKYGNHIDYHTADLRDYDNCLDFTFGMDFVFHLAGIKASPDITNKRPATMSISALQVNTNVLEACREHGVKDVLFTSSIGAYAPSSDILKERNAYIDPPMDFLPGQVKRMAEYQIEGYRKEYGLNYTSVRLANCYGEGDNFNPDNGMFIPSLMAKVLRGDNPVKIWGDGTAIRDFVYSGDVARGILQMMETGYNPVNLGSGRGYTVKEVVESLIEVVEFKYQFDTTEPTGVSKRVLDISKAESEGYVSTTSLKDGLKKTWEWFKANPKEYERRLNVFR